MNGHRVTIVMTVRERYRLTLASIENVLERTPIPHRFIFAHGALPQWLEAGVASLAAAGRIESRRFEGEPWPQRLRKAVMGEVDTDYVVFLDNDVVVSPGWLERLLECADETGAGAVGPLYLQGDGHSPPRIHMAGGRLARSPLPGGGSLIHEEHLHMNADPLEIRPKLARAPCDTLEFHCMLLPSALARDPGVLDESIACVHEHIDVCLTLRERGLAVVLEPAAQVTFLDMAAPALADVATMRWRWSHAAIEASIAAFSAKWNVPPDERSFRLVREYAALQRTRFDPLRGDGPNGDRAVPMSAAELAQSRSQLLALAQARGYSPGDLRILQRACELAAILVDGGYRPCGRHFAQHLFGTAGVLVRYGFIIDVVLEGLLHAAYTHARFPAGEIQKALVGIHPNVELRVRDYAQRSQLPHAASLADASPREAEIAAVEAANEIDMRFSGEYDYSGRRDEIDAANAANLAALLEFIGAGGMARTLHAAMARRTAVPVELQTRMATSYWMDRAGQRAPMAGVLKPALATT